MDATRRPGAGRPGAGRPGAGRPGVGRSGVGRLGVDLPLGRAPAEVRRRLDTVERLLERAFVIPGIRRNVGLDAIVGLVPVAGDLVGASVGLYLIWEARNLGLSKWTVARMLGNVGLDTALGAVPVVGDVFDFVFRSNTRNMRIIRKHLDRHHPGASTIEQ